jgi:hypothetical protein
MVWFVHYLTPCEIGVSLRGQRNQHEGENAELKGTQAEGRRCVRQSPKSKCRSRLIPMIRNGSYGGYLRLNTGGVAPSFRVSSAM